MRKHINRLINHLSPHQGLRRWLASTIAAGCCMTAQVNAQVLLTQQDFAPVYSTTAFQEVHLIGNHNLLCNSTNTALCDRYYDPDDDLSNNNISVTNLDIDDGLGIPGAAGTFNSSNAEFSIPANVTIAFAWLTWQSQHSSTLPVANRQTVLLSTNLGAYTTITAQRGGQADNTSAFQFSGYGADVTNLIAPLGVGNHTITVADIDAALGGLPGGGSAGWSLTLVYSECQQNLFDLRYIGLFDGLRFGIDTVIDIPFSGFDTGPTPPVGGTRALLVGVDGDLTVSSTDRLSFGPNLATLVDLFDALHPANNFMNSRQTAGGVYMSTNPAPQVSRNENRQLGFVDLVDLAPNPAFNLPVNTTSALLEAATSTNEGLVYKHFGISFESAQLGPTCADFGDAPASFVEASHELMLPAAPQAFTGATPPDRDPNGTSNAFPDDTNAAGDDGHIDDDEDGFQTLQPYITAGGMTCTGSTGTYTTQANEYCVVVSATNNTANPAQLWGFLDYDVDGTFSAAERSDPIAANPDDDGTFATGNVPANSTSNNYVLVFQGLPDTQSSETYIRIRITTDTDIDGDNPFSDASPPAGGVANDGEVEDALVPAGTLPVTLDSFASRNSGSSIRFKWRTSSETFNFGFNVWGQVEGKWYRLNKAVVPARGADSLVSRSYQKRVSVRDLPGEVTRVGLSSVEINGHEEFYGPYAVGEAAGAELIIEPIDWNQVSAEATAAFRNQGYVQRGRNYVKQRTAGRLSAASLSSAGFESNESLSGNPVLAEFRTENIGMHRVTHAHLMSAGIDLRGTQRANLALLNQGDAQVRFINTINWRSNSYIDFYNAGVNDELSLHTTESVYRLELDSSGVNVLQAGRIDRVVNQPDSTHTARITRNEQHTYDFVMPKPDPWYERYLVINPTSAGSAATLHSFTLGNASLDASGGDASVNARVVTLSDFVSGVDHKLQLIHVNGSSQSVLDTQTADGYGVVELNGQLSAAALAASNQFKVQLQLIDVDPNTNELPSDWWGSSAYFDSASVSYTTANDSSNNVLHWQNDAPVGDGYTISGFSTGGVHGYAHANGSLMRLIGQNPTSGANGWTVEIPAIATGEADYWASPVSAFYSPVIAAPELDRAGLATGNSDYLIIAHPTFLDRITNPAPVEQDFVANKQSHGHRVKVADYEQVAQIYGHGYRTPHAITAYVAAETLHNPNLKYVLLVGNASRDPNDYTGNGSWNLIPTYYDSTHSFLHYAPNDGRLADIDIDGDGFQDLAIGRWPARTEADLNAMINKTIAYTDGTETTQATQSLNTAVLAADVNDGVSFSAQMDSVDARLQQVQFTTTQVYKDNGDTSQDLINAINAGQSITTYSGHAGPSQWSYNGVLRYNQVSQLTNTDHPTLMLPLSCYTTYTVSEHTNTLGQQLMSHNGGAVAMMGAASLSDYTSNQIVITGIIESMTTGVDTDNDNRPDITLSLGEAVTTAKRALGNAGSAVNISGNLVGDPSIRIRAENSVSNMAVRALRSY